MAARPGSDPRGLLASWLLAAVVFAVVWSVMTLWHLNNRFEALETLVRQRLVQDATHACNAAAEAAGEAERFGREGSPHAAIRLDRDERGQSTAFLEIPSDMLVCETSFGGLPRLNRTPDSDAHELKLKLLDKP